VTALGAFAGMLLGSGLLLLAAALPGRRRHRLVQRLAPYQPGRAWAPAARGGPVGALEALVRPALRDLAAVLDRRLGGRAALERRLDRAGRAVDADSFRAEQVVWGALGLAAAVGLLLLLLARGRAVAIPTALVALVLGAVGGVLAREWSLDREVSRRSRRMAAEFPTVAELLAFAVAAGEGTSGALARVAGRARGDLGRELARAVAEARAGATLVESLRALADRTGLAVVQRFVDGVVIALERGTPMAEVLRAQAADARAAGRRELLEQAGRKEIAMLIPVVFLVLPAVVVVALFPGLYGVVLAVP
jgi:tight adherence protein C